MIKNKLIRLNSHNINIKNNNIDIEVVKLSQSKGA